MSVGLIANSKPYGSKFTEIQRILNILLKMKTFLFISDGIGTRFSNFYSTNLIKQQKLDYIQRKQPVLDQVKYFNGSGIAYSYSYSQSERGTWNLHVRKITKTECVNVECLIRLRLFAYRWALPPGRLPGSIPQAEKLCPSVISIVAESRIENFNQSMIQSTLN